LYFEGLGELLVWPQLVMFAKGSIVIPSWALGTLPVQRLWLMPCPVLRFVHSLQSSYVSREGKIVVEMLIYVFKGAGLSVVVQRH